MQKKNLPHFFKRTGHNEKYFYINKLRNVLILCKNMKYLISIVLIYNLE